MPFESIVGYVIILTFWFVSISRDGGIGIGVRFMYGVNLFLFFLLGPLLGAIFDQHTQDPRFTNVPMGPAINIALIAFLTYITSAYWLAPALFGRKSIIPIEWRSQMRAPSRLKTEKYFGWFFLIVGIAVSPFAKFMLSFPTLGAIISQSVFLADTGLLILCINSRFSKQSKGLLLASVLYVFKCLLFATMSGHAGWLFINGIIIFAIWQFTEQFRISRLPVMFAVALVFFIPATYWLQGRQTLRTAISEDASLSTTVWMTLDVFLTPPETSVSLVKTYRDRGDFSDLMAATLVHTPAVEPFALGESYWQIFVAVVPRAIWPDKPIVMGGNQFVTRFSGVQFGGTTSVAMSYMFEMYVNFGYFGVFFGMTLLGLFLAKIESLTYFSTNVLFECLAIHLGWVICIFSDKAFEAIMTSLPAIALVWSVYTFGLWLLRSKFAQRNQLFGTA